MDAVVELIRTDDPVLLSWVKHSLAEAGITAHVFDDHTASLMPGVLSAVGARVMIEEADLGAARLILAGAPGGERAE